MMAETMTAEKTTSWLELPTFRFKVQHANHYNTVHPEKHWVNQIRASFVFDLFNVG